MVDAGSWMIHLDADPSEVEALVEAAAHHLGIDPPAEVDGSVSFPVEEGRVALALDAVDPGWRDRRLIKPPPHPED